MTNQIDKAPAGATHRYEHGGMISWYREVDGKLFVWRDGSWCGAAFKTTEDLMNSCMLGRVIYLPMEQAEDDLTWLARNTHKWPDIVPGRAVAAAFVSDGSVRWLEYPPVDWDGCYRKHEWLASRAKLQNKPSWKDAPEWATLLAQDSAAEDGLGAWWWYEAAPTACERTWSHQGRAHPAQFKGEVLGDWRDTLEQRPVSARITGSEAAAGLKAFQIKAADTINWSTAPAGATHHIGGNKLEFPWHRVGGPLRYWNGEIWVKRSAFHTLDEAIAKGFDVVVRPINGVFAPILPLQHIKFSFKIDDGGHQFLIGNAGSPVTVPLDKRKEYGTMTVAEWVEKNAGKPKDDPSRSAGVIAEALRILLKHPDHFSSDELAELDQLCDAELTKRDAAVCGGQKYLDAHWFERGELPPVGTECEYTLGDCGIWYRCKINYVIAGDGVVMQSEAAGEQYCSLHSKQPVTFRPVRTERDQLADLLTKASTVYQAADAILAAGFKRGGAA